MVKKRGRKNRTLELTKPEQGAGLEYHKQATKQVVKIRPFKARQDLMRYPVRKGQGVTINGWQFEVKTIQPNGMLYLRPIGAIIEDLTPAPKAELKKEAQAGE